MVQWIIVRMGDRVCLGRVCPLHDLVQCLSSQVLSTAKVVSVVGGGSIGSLVPSVLPGTARRLGCGRNCCDGLSGVVDPGLSCSCLKTRWMLAADERVCRSRRLSKTGARELDLSMKALLLLGSTRRSLSVRCLRLRYSYWGWWKFELGRGVRSRDDQVVADNTTRSPVYRKYQ